jgi:hypothetical protein
LQRNRLRVPIAGQPLPSLPGNKSSSHPRVLPMNLNVVRSAGELRKNRKIAQLTIRTAIIEDKRGRGGFILRNTCRLIFLACVYSEINFSGIDTRMNIYVGNLSLEINEEELRQKFKAFEQVKSVTVMNDKDISSGQARGYGFVEMPSQSEGMNAIVSLNGKELRDTIIYLVESLAISNDGDKGYYSVKKHRRLTGSVRHRK